jgi:hypothetical protein
LDARFAPGRGGPPQSKLNRLTETLLNDGQ